MYKKVWSHAYRHAKKHKLHYIIGLSLFIIAQVVQMIIPTFVRTIVDSALDGVFATQTLIIATVVILGQNILYRIFDILFITAQTRTFSDLYNYGFDSIMQHSYSFFFNTFMGSLIAKVKRFAHTSIVVQDVFLFTILKAGVQALTASIILFFFEPLLAVIMLVWITIYTTISIWLTKWQRKYDEQEAEQDTKTTSILSDIVSNVLTVKMFATAKQEARAFHAEANRLGKYMATSWFKAMRVWATQGFLMACLEVAAIWVIAHGLTNQTMTPGTAILIQTYVLLILGQVWGIGRGVQKISKGFSDMKELVDLIETPVEVTDKTKPEKSSISRGVITFDKVTFGYKDDKTTVLKKFSLHIKKGEKVGLVGLSGSGKTTITKLLLRFMDVQQGSITIDGQDIRKLRQEELRRSITYVPQEPLLFHRSIRENISYAKPRAKTKDIEKAARQAYADKFIKNLPDGYKTLVGERGIKLSGGERQRVAIARAILKQAPIIVMDEATSSLDTISEKYIQEATEKLMRNKTAIVIAHRLSTVQRMDRIIVLNKGKIVEEGTHKQLLKKKGHYYKLYKHQQL